MKIIKFIFILMIFILLFSYLIYSIVAPLKNKEVGAVVGRVRMHIDKDWVSLKSGIYNEFYLYIFNKDTGKEYNVHTFSDGVFYLLNIPKGEYILKTCDFEYEHTQQFMIYYIKNIRFRNEITFNVQPNSITICKTVMMRGEFKNVLDPNTGTESEKVFIATELIDDTKYLLDRFRGSDNNSKWSNFNYIYQ